MGSVCVFASANDTLPAGLRDAAEAAGAGIARLGHTLVYGGSSRGLMGAAARGAVAGGGRVVGVMPRHLAGRERAAIDIAEIHLVDTLSERKQRMADLSDLFLVLPGGVGTLDEALEMITWFDVGLSRKPTLFVDVDGFWQDFAAMMAGLRARGVLRPDIDGAWRLLPDIDTALEAVATWFAPRAA
ncbi:TIGR00730 family Rossman fold protein [Elioraea sp.]|uniref:LOG family protein n=1 Tax=Elioraea sp. TaxID=2185103 RepID=UPI0025C05852|nr:TIGR00730 family Rossman fold protein [Elioraea sp.]